MIPLRTYGCLALFALAVGPCGASLERSPWVEVRKPDGILHAGVLPPPDAPLEHLPGQWLELPDSTHVTSIDVKLGTLRAADDGTASSRVTLFHEAVDLADGTRRPDGVTVEVTGPGWVSFPVEERADTRYRGGPTRFHLAAEGDLRLVPWLRPRGTVQTRGGWGDQAREVDAIRGTLPLHGTRNPTAVVFPARSLGAAPDRHARLRLIDGTGQPISAPSLPEGLALGTSWLWFPVRDLHGQGPLGPLDEDELRYELSLPPGTTLVGAGGQLRPTVVMGRPDEGEFPAMGFLRGDVRHDDRDLLFRVRLAGGPAHDEPAQSAADGRRLDVARLLALVGLLLVLVAGRGAAWRLAELPRP